MSSSGALLSPVNSKGEHGGDHVGENRPKALSPKMSSGASPSITSGDDGGNNKPSSSGALLSPLNSKGEHEGSLGGQTRPPPSPSIYSSDGGGDGGGSERVPRGSLDRYVMGEEIGLGVTSHVFRARMKDSGTEVAVKCMAKVDKSGCRWVGLLYLLL